MLANHVCRTTGVVACSDDFDGVCRLKSRLRLRDKGVNQRVLKHCPLMDREIKRIIEQKRLAEAQRLLIDSGAKKLPWWKRILNWVHSR